MHKIDWSDIHQFLAIASAGSATQAAAKLGINHTTVYRRMAGLERKIGKKLFERSTSGWLITPLGEQILSYAESMAEDANTIERKILSDTQDLSGTLRITVGESCTDSILMPVIRQFTTRYPEVQLEIITSTDELDLAAREADIALRATDNPPENLVGKRIGSIAYAIYGNRDLVRMMPSNPDQEVPCITWLGDSHTRPAWIKDHFPQIHKVYRATSTQTMLSMVRESIGIAKMSCMLCDPDPMLERIPMVSCESGPALWVLSHVDLRTTARVRIFRDFLVEALENKIDLIEGRSL
ncbi:MAG: LysR family transcriptional regulator [Candidatus Thiodiazotropha taylori]|nr:LysR family transcriptional regulator [Candidatus Thiodiazotropha endolucinida]MCW4229476.1 LysR family transcriptional regulator [Candidatus Thiodiazotropha taylori]